LKVRVGIATGLVLVGDLIGCEAQERGIVGETPNLAARLQGIAEPNTVVIAEGTRRLLGNLFKLRDLGARELKGIAGPTRAAVPVSMRSGPLLRVNLSRRLHSQMVSERPNERTQPPGSL
jgi:class 3 adenylate cyclase